jgi:hypothetical protein
MERHTIKDHGKDYGKLLPTVMTPTRLMLSVKQKGKKMSDEIRTFITLASSPSFDMMGKGHLIPTVTNKFGASWDLPTMAELMSADYQTRNVNLDGSWIPA